MKVFSVILCLTMIIANVSMANETSTVKTKTETTESKEKNEKILPPHEGGSTVGNGSPKSTSPKKEKTDK